MVPPEADTVLVRHGEVGVKSTRVQSSMEKQLRRNIENILEARGIDGYVERRWSRILIRTTEPERVTEAATDAFGVVSASPVISLEANLEKITDTLEKLGPKVYESGSFAVKARRAGKKEVHPFSSKELEEKGGSAVWEAVEGDFEPEVDLDEPDTCFYVECRKNEAFIFLEKREGPGGLPLGTQAKTVALVSGGHDSPVAAWEMMKRGCEIVPVYFDLGEYGGVDHEARAVETVAKLSRYAPKRDMAIRKVPAGEVVDYLVEETNHTRMLSLRRFMFRAAEEIARDEDAKGIVTGEAIGQKSSQTSTNIGVTTKATSLPVHRPLLTMDKQEIMDRARQIGTYEDAKIRAGCNRIAPTKPETHAEMDRVLKNEPDDLMELAVETAQKAQKVEIPDKKIGEVSK